MPVEMGCWMEGKDGAACVTIFDLSETGIYMVGCDPLPVGEGVTIKIYTPFAVEAMAINAEVIWSRGEPEGGMGLKFLDIDERTTDILRVMVRLRRAQKSDFLNKRHK